MNADIRRLISKFQYKTLCHKYSITQYFSIHQTFPYLEYIPIKSKYCFHLKTNEQTPL